MFSDAIEASAAGVFSLHRAIKFVIGLDFAVTLSSADSFVFFFDITSEHSAELKWLKLKNHKMIPFITCEVSLGQHVFQLDFGVNTFDLDLGVDIDSIEQPIK